MHPAINNTATEQYGIHDMRERACLLTDPGCAGFRWRLLRLTAGKVVSIALVMGKGFTVENALPMLSLLALIKGLDRSVITHDARVHGTAGSFTGMQLQDILSVGGIHFAW